MRKARNAAGARGASGVRGFTLIELIVTVAVMAIAAITVIPSMTGTGVLRVQAVARTIVADIAFAQSDAMAYQARRVIWFGRVPGEASEGSWSYVEGNGYTVAEVTGPELNLATDALYSPSDPTAPLARDFSKGLDVEVTLTAQFGDEDDETAEWLIFDELGGTAADLTGPDPGPAGVITISSPIVEYQVTIEPLTGRADVVRVE